MSNLLSNLTLAAEWNTTETLNNNNVIYSLQQVKMGLRGIFTKLEQGSLLLFGSSFEGVSGIIADMV